MCYFLALAVSTNQCAYIPSFLIQPTARRLVVVVDVVKSSLFLVKLLSTAMLSRYRWSRKTSTIIVTVYMHDCLLTNCFHFWFAPICFRIAIMISLFCSWCCYFCDESYTGYIRIIMSDTFSYIDR